eukprot:CAMPEP_0197847272 /NCGR_PEP_ID=MMETSP1438-20131217/5681_1 /TAXON_ID=1461541 /ORGANISM="Pterosperma sp., Strain CCMP1384" /LENGTH=318 /DNA_ID=CAMNT_0043459147 /DNA_START=17 /DNA_END=973 /DNA_ORIENTATION=-
MKIQQIHVYGERHSGTKFLIDVLQKAIDDADLAERVNPELNFEDVKPLGHKHWAGMGSARDRMNKPPPRNTFAVDTKGVLFLMLARDPYDWLKAMHKFPHHAPALFDLDFETFLKTEWASYTGPDWHLYFDAKRRMEIVKPENEDWGDRDLECKRLANVAKFRNYKFKAYWDLQNHVENWGYVKYEELLANPGAVVYPILKSFNIPIKANLDIAVAECLSFKAIQQSFLKSYLEHYTPEIIEHVNKNLDWEQEKQLKYESICGATLVCFKKQGKQPSTSAKKVEDEVAGGGAVANKLCSAIDFVSQVMQKVVVTVVPF